MGRYKSLGAMIVDGGGWNDPASVKAAMTVAKKCLAMGGNWWMVHPQSGRKLYLELDFTFAEHFTKSWSEFVDAVEGDNVNAQDDTAKMDETATGASSSSTSVAKALDKAAKGKGKCTPKSKAATVKKDPDNVQDTAKSLSALYASALKHRANFLAAVASAAEIEKAIDENPAWSWAANEQHRGELVKLVHGCREKVDDFGRNFLVEEPAVIKKRYQPEFLTVGLKAFTTMDYKPLANFVAKLRKRNSA